MKVALNTLWASTRRTFVPLIVGAVLGWLIRMGIPLDPELEGSLYSVIDLILAGAYWLVARLLELYVSPKFSVLLGSTKQPMIYANTDNGGIPVITGLHEGVETASITLGSKK